MASHLKALRTSPRSAAVTPNDGADLPGGLCSCLVIAVGGTLHYVDADGEVSTTVPAGTFPVQIRKVFATGTAATGITALYEKVV